MTQRGLKFAELEKNEEIKNGTGLSDDEVAVITVNPSRGTGDPITSYTLKITDSNGDEITGSPITSTDTSKQNYVTGPDTDKITATLTNDGESGTLFYNLYTVKGEEATRATQRYHTIGPTSLTVGTFSFDRTGQSGGGLIRAFEKNKIYPFRDAGGGFADRWVQWDFRLVGGDAGYGRLTSGTPFTSGSVGPTFSGANTVPQSSFSIVTDVPGALGRAPSAWFSINNPTTTLDLKYSVRWYMPVVYSELPNVSQFSAFGSGVGTTYNPSLTNTYTFSNTVNLTTSGGNFVNLAISPIETFGIYYSGTTLKGNKFYNRYNFYANAQVDLSNPNGALPQFGSYTVSFLLSYSKMDFSGNKEYR